MNQMIWLVLAIFVAGCASTPPVADNGLGGGKKVKGPSVYSYGIKGMTLTQVSSSSCPKGEVKETAWKSLVSMASGCAKALQWPEVEKVANQLAISNPEAPWGAYFLSLAAEARRDYPRARWMVDLALKKAPEDGLLLYQLGRLQWQMDERAAALVSLEKSVTANPSLGEAHALMGQLALIQDKTSDAERHFSKAYALDSKHLPTLLGLADVHLRGKAWDKAQGYLKQAVSYHPRSTRAHSQWAQAQEQFGNDPHRALQGYKDLKRMSVERKLDEALVFNVDEKIQSLESMVSQASKKVSTREPSGDKQGKVAK